MARAWPLLVLALSACAQPNYADPDALKTSPTPATESCKKAFRSGQSVSLTWETPPTEEDFGAFRFQITRPEPPGAVSVLLWMPSMGHGSSPVTVTKLGEGDYRASNVFFTMGGEWEIRFQMKTGETLEDEACLPFRF